MNYKFALKEWNCWWSGMTLEDLAYLEVVVWVLGAVLVIDPAVASVVLLWNWLSKWLVDVLQEPPGISCKTREWRLRINFLISSQPFHDNFSWDYQENWCIKTGNHFLTNFFLLTQHIFYILDNLWSGIVARPTFLSMVSFSTTRMHFMWLSCFKTVFEHLRLGSILVRLQWTGTIRNISEIP